MARLALADPRRKWGTVTPHYMVGGKYQSSDNPNTGNRTSDGERTVPLRIHECLPDVRLIAILRDLVERARSHHKMTSMMGLDSCSFDTAIAPAARSGGARTISPPPG